MVCPSEVVETSGLFTGTRAEFAMQAIDFFGVEFCIFLVGKVGVLVWFCDDSFCVSPLTGVGGTGRC